MRRFVVGDIHGCAKTFKHLVKHRFQLRRQDVLYTLGDHIDRGPDSRGVIDALMALDEAGFTVRPLKGNHEDLLLDALAGDACAALNFIRNGGMATMESFGANSISTIDERYLRYIQGFPLRHELDNFILVHAGLNFRQMDPLDTPEHDQLWMRGGGEVDPVRLGQRRLVTGHTIRTMDEIVASIATNHIRLDNGCFTRKREGCGALVGYCLDSGELFIQQNVERLPLDAGA